MSKSINPSKLLSRQILLLVLLLVIGPVQAQTLFACNMMGVEMMEDECFYLSCSLFSRGITLGPFDELFWIWRSRLCESPMSKILEPSCHRWPFVYLFNKIFKILILDTSHVQILHRTSSVPGQHACQVWCRRSEQFWDCVEWLTTNLFLIHTQVTSRRRTLNTWVQPQRLLSPPPQRVWTTGRCMVWWWKSR